MIYLRLGVSLNPIVCFGLGQFGKHAICCQYVFLLMRSHSKKSAEGRRQEGMD